jgi:hypothetical protein
MILSISLGEEVLRFSSTTRVEITYKFATDLKTQVVREQSQDVGGRDGRKAHRVSSPRT